LEDELENYCSNNLSPMNANPDPIHLTLQNAMAAMKRGDRATARQLAEQAIALAPGLEAPWLILAALSAPAESLDYAQRALQINPESKAAQKAVQWAREKLQKSTPPEELEQSVQRIVPSEIATMHGEQAPPKSPTPLIEQATAESFTPPVEEAAPPAVTAPPDTQVHRPPAVPPELRAEVARKLEPEIEPEFVSSPTVTARPRKQPAPTARILGYVLLVLIILAIIAGVILLIPQLSNLLGGLTSEGGCQASLILGGQSFEIRTIVPKSDGSFKMPRSTPERLYWLQGTDINLVFVIPPTADNARIISSINTGHSAELSWPDCTTTTYTLSAVSHEQPFDLAQLKQGGAQITIFFPGPSTASGYFLVGDLVR